MALTEAGSLGLNGGGAAAAAPPTHTSINRPYASLREQALLMLLWRV